MGLLLIWILSYNFDAYIYIQIHIAIDNHMWENLIVFLFFLSLLSLRPWLVSFIVWCSLILIKRWIIRSSRWQSLHFNLLQFSTFDSDWHSWKLKIYHGSWWIWNAWAPQCYGLLIGYPIILFVLTDHGKSMVCRFEGWWYLTHIKRGIVWWPHLALTNVLRKYWLQTISLPWIQPG